MFLSKAFPISEIDIYPISKSNYYKKVQEWLTDDVDGYCISFNLYRNTKKSINLLKRWRGDYKTEERRVLPDLSTMFLFRTVNSD